MVSFKLGLLFIYLVHGASCLLCYNGSFTHKDYGEDPITYRGLFGPPREIVAREQCSRTISCDDTAMCFVRSWRARANHAWIVQRGCYQSAGATDPVLRMLNRPTRAMTCTQRRLIEAEYKVCLCRSNWCNSAFTNDTSKLFLICMSLLLCLNYLFNGVYISYEALYLSS